MKDKVKRNQILPCSLCQTPKKYKKGTLSCFAKKREDGEIDYEYKFFCSVECFGKECNNRGAQMYKIN
jgi:hypothetical protein